MRETEKKDLPPLAERRPRPRKRVLQGGIIVYDHGRTLIQCKIRDLNDGGARIAVPRGRHLPIHVYLINVPDSTGHEAQVTWRRGEEAGLVFTKSFDLETVSDPGLGYLRQIWNQRSNVNAGWRS